MTLRTTIVFLSRIILRLFTNLTVRQFDMCRINELWKSNRNQSALKMTRPHAYKLCCVQNTWTRVSRTMKTQISEPLYMPLETLTSSAWPSSISNVTTQKQVTHFLKRSQGKIGPSNSLWRNISSPSQTAIFSPTPSVFFSGGRI